MVSKVTLTINFISGTVSRFGLLKNVFIKIKIFEHLFFFICFVCLDLKDFVFKQSFFYLIVVISYSVSILKSIFEVANVIKVQFLVHTYDVSPTKSVKQIFLELTFPYCGHSLIVDVKPPPNTIELIDPIEYIMLTYS